MKKVVIFHNPRCQKSRQTLALLQDNGVEPEVVEYLKDPPSEKRVLELMDLLGLEPHDLLRKKEKEYAEAGLSPKSGKRAIAKAIAAHPVLLERPVVVAGKKAALGRPPENVLKIL
jgi:arsenate reductase